MKNFGIFFYLILIVFFVNLLRLIDLGAGQSSEDVSSAYSGKCSGVGCFSARDLQRRGGASSRDSGILDIFRAVYAQFLLLGNDIEFTDGELRVKLSLNRFFDLKTGEFIGQVYYDTFVRIRNIISGYGFGIYVPILSFSIEGAIPVTDYDLSAPKLDYSDFAANLLFWLKSAVGFSYKVCRVGGVSGSNEQLVRVPELNISLTLSERIQEY